MTDKMISEKRHQDRRPTSIPARLLSDKLAVPCTILDLSATGARLKFEPGLFLPKRFVLRATDLGGDRAVEVVWRNRTQMGVRF